MQLRERFEGHDGKLIDIECDKDMYSTLSLSLAVISQGLAVYIPEVSL